MKSIKNKIMVSLLPLIFMSGCSDKKEEKKETFKTVEYYDTHIEERNERIKECKNNGERTMTTLLDCDNATASYDNEKRGVPLDW